MTNEKLIELLEKFYEDRKLEREKPNGYWPHHCMIFAKALCRLLNIKTERERFEEEETDEERAASKAFFGSFGASGYNPFRNENPND